MPQDILSLIGNTPLISVKDEKPHIALKLESFNPGGSIKDRVVAHIVTTAERAGALVPGMRLVEATSGNTGIAVAMVAAARGYKATIVTHQKASLEKLNAIRHYGAQVIVARTGEPPNSQEHYIQIARRLALDKKCFLIDQFNSQLNPEAHFIGTGPELWKQTDGSITCLVCGIGSGGTISGLGKFLKGKNPRIIVIGADPVGSLYAQHFHDDNKIISNTWNTEGVGTDFIPPIMDFNMLDDVLRFTDDEARAAALSLRSRFGISVGPSTGGAFHIAQALAASYRGSYTVVIAPDSVDRYFSKLNCMLALEAEEISLASVLG